MARPPYEGNMKFTTEEDRICCGGYVFRKGRVVDVTTASGIEAAKGHKGIKPARTVGSKPDPKAVARPKK